MAGRRPTTSKNDAETGAIDSDSAGDVPASGRGQFTDPITATWSNERERSRQSTASP